MQINSAVMFIYFVLVLSLIDAQKKLQFFLKDNFLCSEEFKVIS